MKRTTETISKEMKKSVYGCSFMSWQKQPYDSIPVRFARCIVINTAL